MMRALRLYRTGGASDAVTQLQLHLQPPRLYGHSAPPRTHDCLRLGRSTARGALLLWTHLRKKMTWHTSFPVGSSWCCCLGVSFAVVIAFAEWSLCSYPTRARVGCPQCLQMHIQLNYTLYIGQMAKLCITYALDSTALTYRNLRHMMQYFLFLSLSKSMTLSSLGSQGRCSARSHHGVWRASTKVHLLHCSS